VGYIRQDSFVDGYSAVVENINNRWTIKKISSSQLRRTNDSQEVIYVAKNFDYVQPWFEEIPSGDNGVLFSLCFATEKHEKYSPCGKTELTSTAVGRTALIQIVNLPSSIGLATIMGANVKFVDRNIVEKILRETYLITAAKAFDVLFIKSQGREHDIIPFVSPEFLRFGNFKPSAEEAANSIKIASFDVPLEESVSLWNVYTGREIVKFFASAKNDEWIAITPEGYYTASQNGAKYLKVSIDSRVFRLDQYEERLLRRPDIVKLALNKGDSLVAMKELGAQPIQLATIQPSQIWFVEPALPPKEYQTDHGSVKVVVQTENLASSAEAVSFTVNQRPVKKRAVGTEKGKKVRRPTGGTHVNSYTQQIPLRIGHNWIHAQVRSQAGTVQRTKYPLVVVRKNVIKPQPDLYYLGIGVAQYRQPALQLKYPAKDVKDLETILKQQQGKAYRNVVTKLLTNQQATRSNLNHVVKTFFKRAKPGDIAILFISGHGMNTRQGYHFLTYDAHPEQLETTGVSWETFKALGDIDAHVLLLADTCHAGNIKGNTDWQERAKADPHQFLGEANLHNVVILASSSGADVSQEKDSLENGVFTEALIEGLSGKAADDKGIVDIALLQRYVRETVLKLTEGAQKPTISIEGLDDVLDLVLAKK